MTWQFKSRLFCHWRTAESCTVQRIDLQLRFDAWILNNYIYTVKHMSTPLARAYVGERNENFLLHAVPHDDSAPLENEDA